jgi:hypothetical protein
MLKDEIKKKINLKKDKKMTQVNMANLWNLRSSS